MKLTAYPKTIFCLALLLGWGNCVPPATAQSLELWAWHELVIVSSLQTVEAHTPRDRYHAVFQSEARVFPNGAARGFLTLIPTDSAVVDPTMPNVVFVGGNVRFNRDGTVAGVLLRGRTEEGDLVVIRISPAATEDCLIYTTVGSDIHATWEAPGQVTLLRR